MQILSEHLKIDKYCRELHNISKGQFFQAIPATFSKPLNSAVVGKMNWDPYECKYRVKPKVAVTCHLL